MSKIEVVYLREINRRGIE